MKKFYYILFLFLFFLTFNITASAKLYSSSFDENTNQIITIGEVTLEVPEAWTASEDNDEDYMSFTFNNGEFIVQREKHDGDILGYGDHFEYIYAFLHLDDCENLEDYDAEKSMLNACDKEVRSYYFSCTVSGIDTDIYSTMGSFEDDTYLILFTLYDYADSSLDHSKDYYAILDSVTINGVESNVEKNENTYIMPESESNKQSDSVETLGEQNALKKANSYLNVTAMSYSGLIKQLERDGFTTSESTYAADNCGADWNEQAVMKAQKYLDVSAYSKESLKRQLENDGFTTDESTYAINNCGADWNEQAAKRAQKYLDVSAYSKEGLKKQLENDGFTSEQANYGVKAVGY